MFGRSHVDDRFQCTIIELYVSYKIYHRSISITTVKLIIKPNMLIVATKLTVMYSVDSFCYVIHLIMYVVSKGSIRWSVIRLMNWF